MSFNSQRDALCDALDAVHPDAPTLCNGWTAHHLAAHLWLRENDALAAAGIVLPALAPHADRRLNQIVAERPYAELVATIRRGPSLFSPFRFPGAEAAANPLEFFVHCEDVRRGGGVNTPRELDPVFENLAWKRLGSMGRMLLRGCPVAVLLERDAHPGQVIRIGRGPDIVTLLGRPSELVLYVWGRKGAANVELIGEPASVAVLARAKLGS